MELVSEVLDNQLVDRNEVRMGRADGVVAVLRKDQPPRLAYIESGPITLAGRLHPRLGRWLANVVSKCDLTYLESYRVPWPKVLDVGIDIQLDLEAEHTAAFAWERWLRKHIIGRIPGA
jgi:hypothetical protein